MVPDLAPFQACLAQVQTVYGLILGLFGYNIDGGKMDNDFVQWSIRQARNPEMGAAVLYQALLLMMLESRERFETDEEAVAHWLEVYAQADLSRMAQRPMPEREFLANA